MTTVELKSSLGKFAAFARSLRGDKKSEAQRFLERFFRALGHEGVMEAGATFEFRIAKKPGTAQLELIKVDSAQAKGGKKFADLLWPERALIEMKSRSAMLDDPVDRVSLRELGDRSAAFNFLLPHAQKPVFDNNRVEVTRKAAHNFGEVFRKMLASSDDRARVQRFQQASWKS